MLICYFISRHFSAVVEIFSQSPTKSEDEEVERHPGSITELSPEYSQIINLVQYLKVDH